jgi:hypothetical protein
MGSSPHTLVEHWNGAAWSIVTSPNATQDTELLGVTCTSASDCWAVGNYLTDITGNLYYQTLIEHWNGSSWRRVPSPNPRGPEDELLAISARSARDIWAVGDHRAGAPDLWRLRRAVYDRLASPGLRRKETTTFRSSDILGRPTLVLNDTEDSLFTLHKRLATLDPDSAILMALTAMQPPAPPADIKFHSLIGSLRPTGIDKTTDGVVPYRSAHIDTNDAVRRFVVGERVVRSDHGVQKDPEAIREVALESGSRAGVIATQVANKRLSSVPHRPAR